MKASNAIDVISSKRASRYLRIFACAISSIFIASICGCVSSELDDSSSNPTTEFEVTDKLSDEKNYVEPKVLSESSNNDRSDSSSDAKSASSKTESVDIDIVEDYRSVFVHGDKGAQYQKYIMIHDTEGGGAPQNVVSYWAGNGNLVAAHFVIGKDGTIVQCVPLDKIAHHAGYGDSGHNKKYGITEDGRDDMKGTVPIGSWASDYGMNAWSIGIELVHQGSTDSDYPEAQLKALDKVIAYIDAHYGFESEIIDHKTWRSGNSDTSKEFDKYMKNYQSKRTYK